MAGFGGVGRDGALAGSKAFDAGFEKDGANSGAVVPRFAADGADL